MGVLPLTSKVRLWTPRCQSQKFCFAFALSFLCPFSWPLGGHVRGGSLVKPVRGGADWHGARSTGIDRLDVASGGRQHSLSFILWSILTTLTHTHLHQCSVSLVFISQRTPSGLVVIYDQTPQLWLAVTPQPSRLGRPVGVSMGPHGTIFRSRPEPSTSRPILPLNTGSKERSFRLFANGRRLRPTSRCLFMIK